MSDTLRLSDILARGVSVEWFEAVALARDVADRVRESLAGQGVPELHQIEVSADGHLSLTGATRTDEPLRRLGQLLQAAVVLSDPPVQLRLVISQATAPTPAFGSIRDYSEALAYFERPDRSAVLRGLYERASAAPAAQVEVTPTIDTMAPLEEVRPTKKEEPRKAALQRQKARRAVPALAAAVVLIVSAAAYWQFAGAAPTTASVSAAAVKASDVVGTALVSGLSSVTETVGLGRLTPAGSTGVAPAPPPVVKAAAPVKVASPRRNGAHGAAPTSFRLFDLAPEAVAGLPSMTLPAAAVPSSEVLTVPAYEIDETVYSAADPDVVAPVGVRPQLPAVLPSDVSREHLTQIELLVLPDGTVGAVRLLGRPRSVLEGMLLSAAKAWRFTPASKDGRPVAYRKLVWLVLQ